jgi:hypothetical protein
VATFSELQNRAQNLIRKGLEGSVFVKRYAADDDPIEALGGSSGLLALPPGYDDLGWITKDQGINWTRDIETSDVTSLGASEPTRRDIVSDVSGLQVTAQETKALTLGLYEGLDLSGTARDADGNVVIDKPDRPASIYYRVLGLMKDGDGADAIYIAKWLPRAQIVDRGEQAWNENDEVQYPFTINGFVDPAVGTSQRLLIWSPTVGHIEDMGFAAPAPTP